MRQFTALFLLLPLMAIALPPEGSDSEKPNTGDICASIIADLARIRRDLEMGIVRWQVVSANFGVQNPTADPRALGQMTPAERMAAPILKLRLSLQGRLALTRAGVHTIEELTAKSRTDLSSHMEAAFIREIEGQLSEWDLELASETN